MADPERSADIFLAPPLVDSARDADRLRDELRSAGTRARSMFDSRFPEFLRVAQQQPALFTLSVLATTHLLSFREFGFDPELHADARIDQSEVEVAQGLFMIAMPTTGDHVGNESVIDAMAFHERLQDVVQLRRDSRWAEISVDGDPLEAARGFVLSAVQSDTDTIRNWGYLHQIERIVLGVFNGIEDAFRTEFHCDAAALWRMLITVVKLIEKRLNTHFREIQRVLSGHGPEEILAEYAKTFCLSETEVQTLANLLNEANASPEEARTAIFNLAFGHLQAVYTIGLEDFVECFPAEIEPHDLARVLDKWSARLGSVRVEEPEFVFYDNPVWARPFLKTGPNDYFWPIPGLLNSFGLDLFESLLSENRQLTDAYHRSRATWLEEEVSAVFSSALPNATVVRGSKWRPAATSQQYETDLLVKVGGVLLVVEAKSASVTPAARRGAPKRFARTVRDLIVEPSRQSQRFLHYAFGQSDGSLELTLPDGTTSVLGVSDVLDYARLNITLESLGFGGGRWPELRQAGFIAADEQPAPTICIADLFTIAETLDSPLMFLHYLVRRCDFEAEAVYHGDEIDLLALYLDTAFDLQTAGDEAPVLQISLMSKNLDPYFLWRARPELASVVPKPVMRQTRWWRTILERIAAQESPHWTRAGLTLLDLGLENQRAFRKAYQKVRSRVRHPDTNAWHWEFLTYASAESNRRTLVTGLLYRGLDTTERDLAVSRAADDAFTRAGADSLLIIGEDVMKEHDAPYGFAALILRPDSKPRCH